MGNNITVKQIVEQWLRDNDYSGLQQPAAGCACGLRGDLMTCDMECSTCEPIRFICVKPVCKEADEFSHDFCYCDKNPGLCEEKISKDKEAKANEEYNNHPRSRTRRQ